MAYFQDGKVWDVLNDTAQTIEADSVTQVGTNVGLVVSDIPPGNIGAVRMIGTLQGAKPSGEVWTQNAELNFDLANKWFTTQPADIASAGLAATDAASDAIISSVYITPKLYDVKVNSYNIRATDDAGDGTIQGDMNATDFTSQLGTTYWFPQSADAPTVVHKDIAYMYVGPREVKIGVGGDYISQNPDYSAVGSIDHRLATNRTSPDQHPTSAITGLDDKQAAQDQDLIDHAALINVHHSQAHDHSDADPSGTVSHADIKNRSANFCHPTSAITGLDSDQATQDQNLVDHETDPDPHTQYILNDEGLATFTGAGYGAIYQNTGQTIGTLGATWTQLTLDTARISSPKGVIQNPGNSTLSIQYAGIWQIAVSATLTFADLNAGRQLGIRLNNVTTGTPGSGLTVFVARNVDGVNISFTSLLEITEAETNNEWSVQVAGQGGDTFSTCEVLNANHDLIHVGELAGLITG